MNPTAVLVALCRWAPYALLAAVIAVLLLDVPLPRFLLAALLLTCLVVLVFLSWSAQGRSTPLEPGAPQAAATRPRRGSPARHV